MATPMRTSRTPRCRSLAAPLALLASGGGLSAPALADTSAEFDVAARIVSGCLVDGLGGSGQAGTIGTLDFGSDSTFSSATHDATTTANQSIRLRCTPGVALTMSIDGGRHSALGWRHLQHQSNSVALIGYRICRDAGCTQFIPIGGTTSVAVTGANSEDVRLPLHATLTLPRWLLPGTYTDTLTVTLAW